MDYQIRAHGNHAAAPDGQYSSQIRPACASCGEALIGALLAWLGEDPDREGLQGTPARVVQAWRDFMAQERDSELTGFVAVKADQMVLVNDVTVWSMCEHHLLPFKVDLAMAYITGDRVLGLSKFVRLARRCAGKLQLQERLVEECAALLSEATGTENVAVLGRGRHTCMEMRGVRSDALVTTSALHGDFRTQPELRAEFLRLARG